MSTAGINLTCTPAYPTSSRPRLLGNLFFFSLKLIFVFPIYKCLSVFRLLLGHFFLFLLQINICLSHSIMLFSCPSLAFRLIVLLLLWINICVGHSKMLLCLSLAFRLFVLLLRINVCLSYSIMLFSCLSLAFRLFVLLLLWIVICVPHSKMLFLLLLGNFVFFSFKLIFVFPIQ